MKILIAIILWIFIPFSFFTYSKKHRLLNVKLSAFLSIISPINIIVCCFIFLFITFQYTEYIRTHYYIKNSTIERIVGIKIPDYSLIKLEKGKTGFNGDYCDRFYLKFKESLSVNNIKELDSLVTAGRCYKRNNIYSFHNYKPKDNYSTLSLDLDCVLGTITIIHTSY